MKNKYIKPALVCIEVSIANCCLETINMELHDEELGGWSDAKIRAEMYEVENASWTNGLW